jgi:S-adenosyl-L-methionine hydrolase (adenosine-forming)
MAPGFSRPPIITLLTDFGQQDAYVGSMKGVILSLNPEVRLVDLSHAVPPQGVGFGALVLQSAWRYFPPGTIHLGVVDPGVGSRRLALAAACGGQFLVGPDNGLFSLVFAEQSPDAIISLENPRYFRPEVSATFHGRDIFAPVAAHLSLGVPLTDLGPVLPDPVRLDWPAPRFGEAGVTGQVVACDHFGNLISNIPVKRFRAWLRHRSASFRVQGQVIAHFATTYSEVPAGTLLALGGSHGYLEFACRQGSAAQVLGAGAGARVEVSVANIMRTEG